MDDQTKPATPGPAALDADRWLRQERDRLRPELMVHGFHEPRRTRAVPATGSRMADGGGAE